MDTSKEEVVEVVDDRDTSDHELQTDYVKREEQSSSGIGIVYTEQFLKSMRSLGYKSAAYALSEQVDNSIQGGADLIDIRFGGFDRPVGDGKKRNNAIPSQIAVVDNGIGIIPEMIPYTLRWGGTHRHDNREGMGRFGFGLPSSSLHLGTRYTVYSKIASGTWHASTFDLTEVAKTGGDAKALGKLIEPRPANPPEWAVEPTGDDNNGAPFADMQSGTVIVHERVDNLDYKQLNKNREAFFDHFGLVYRKLINGRKIMLDGTFVSPIDPLFLMPDARHYHTPGHSGKAELVRDDKTMVKGDDGEYYPVRVRAAYLEPLFAYSDEARATWSPGSDRRDLANLLHKERMKVMRDTNGYIMMRSGRQIDVISGGKAWQNNHRNIKIEIDIDPGLDSFYQITTAKQQVTLSSHAKEVFFRGSGKHNLGLDRLRSEMIALYMQDAYIEVEDRPTDARDKAVAQVLSILPALEAIDTRTASNKTEALAVDAEKKEVENRQRETNESKEKVEKQIREEAQVNPFEVEFISHGEAPFFTPSRVGQKKKLTIDTLHPWYTKVFVTSSDQDAWLHFLWVLGQAELNAKDPAYQGKDISWLYRHERPHWSRLLGESLDALRSDASRQDRINAIEAAAEMLDEVEETVTSKE
jgi:hypothetical protein